MKKTILSLLLLSFSVLLTAQEPDKRKEVGIVFSNADNFGLTYKTGTEKSLWRFTTLIISGYNHEESSDSLATLFSTMGLGVKIGKEFLTHISDHLELRIGADLSFSYSRSLTETNDKTPPDNDRKVEQTTYRPGINFVMGVNYILNHNLAIGAEILPHFSYSTGKIHETSPGTHNGMSVDSDLSGYNYGISNQSVMVSITYRF